MAVSPSVAAARQRRSSAAATDNVRIQWFIKQVEQAINLPIQKRVKIATELIRDQVVKNISIPVKRLPGSVVRSKPGEYPRADTTLLMKTIFGETNSPRRGVYMGFVGTPIDYGLKLEIKMNRSFLLRTFNLHKSNIIKLLTGPIKGAT